MTRGGVPLLSLEPRASDDIVRDMRNVVMRHPGRVRVTLVLGPRRLMTPWTIDNGAAVRAELGALPGVEVTPARLRRPTRQRRVGHGRRWSR